MVPNINQKELKLAMYFHPLIDVAIIVANEFLVEFAI